MRTGAFNCFDFGIVVAGLAFAGSDSGSAIGALRLLRLLRLLTFVKVCCSRQNQFDRILSLLTFVLSNRTRRNGSIQTYSLGS